MGLDHFLYEVPKIHKGVIYRSDDEIAAEVAPEDQVFKNDWNDPFPHDGDYYHKPGVREMCRWRKFNALHSWMVTHVQGGVDECEPHIVPKSKIEGLHSILWQVREAGPGRPDVAREILPTQAGFFFGSIDYDQWYYEDVKRGVDELELAMREQRPDTDLVYRSSW